MRGSIGVFGAVLVAGGATLTSPIALAAGSPLTWAAPVRVDHQLPFGDASAVASTPRLAADVAGVTRHVNAAGPLGLSAAGGVVSPNQNIWSGYLLSGSTGAFTGITGEWQVPTVASTSGDSYSATWLGIGGNVASDNHLIQIGTEQDWISGAASYYAWWEIYPQVVQVSIPSISVQPGDTIFASIAQDPGSQSWTLGLEDLTTGSTPFISAPETFTGGLTSAEWIVERPLLNGPTTLADYGTVTFDDLAVNGGTPGLTLGDAMVMIDSSTGVQLSTPSDPGGNADSFTVAYGATQPPAPPISGSGPLNRVASVTGGDGSYCAVLTTGGVDCWGDNSLGELGAGLTPGNAQGGTSYSNVPVPVVGIADALEIASEPDGSYCALLTSGGIDCWGYNLYGDLGAGLSPPVDTGSGGGIPDSDVPVAVTGITDATAIVSSDGGDTYCALLDNGGGISCWGSNVDGQLGAGLPAADFGAGSYSDVPVQVQAVGGLVTSIVGMGGGTYYDTFCVLVNTGAVWCWGDDVDGELGAGPSLFDAGYSDAPVAVSGIADARSLVTDDGGTYCAVLDGGGIDCWGYNGGGELGADIQPDLNLDPNDYSTVPLAVSGIQTAVAAVGAPIDDISLGSFEAGLGGGAFCALLSDSTVSCWGNNSDGALGAGIAPQPVQYPVDRLIDYSATPVAVSGINHVVNIVGSMAGTFCAQLASGDLECWGSGIDDTLGAEDANAIYSDVPVLVNGIGDVTAVVASAEPDGGVGGSFCALLTALNLVECWGDNQSGELGAGLDPTTTPDSALPVSVQAALPPLNTTTTTLSTSLNPTAVGQQVTYTASISPVPDGGTVTFSDNGVILSSCGAVPVSAAVAAATCAVTYSGAGEELIRAWFSGNGGFVPSIANSLMQSVNLVAAPSPPTGATGWVSGASNSGSGSATADLGGVSVTADGVGALTLADYGTNPTADASLLSTDQYFDVAVGQGSTFTTITLSVCVDDVAWLKWWNGSVWVSVSPQTAMPPLCVTATLSDTSSPTIAQLSGTPFAAGSSVSLQDAVSTQQYLLYGSDGTTWEAMDTSLLADTFSPTTTGTAVLSANADLWTFDAGFNQDLGVCLVAGAVAPSTCPSGDLLAWKESGGFAGTFSPNAAYVQATTPVTSGTTYTAFVVWKTNKPMPSGDTIAAGAGSSPTFSPTRLTVALPDGSNSESSTSSTEQYLLHGSDGSTWNYVDPSALALTLSPTSAVDTVLSANADLWTFNAGYNQDVGICVAAGASLPAGSCPSSDVVIWKESGGFAGTFSPNAAFAQTVVPMSAGTYSVALVWKANKTMPRGDTIAIGAGGSPSFSPTRLTALQYPASGSGAAIASSTEQYILEGGSDGATWQPIDATHLSLTVPQATGCQAEIGGNADLWTFNAGFNQDIGIQVTPAGGSPYVAAWKESGGFAGTFSPNAAFVQAVIPLSGATSYTITLVWKTNTAMPSSDHIAVAAGSTGAFSPTTLTVAEHC
jgi:alpha-tubulin suppressor-like RCC1 family protein